MSEIVNDKTVFSLEEAMKSIRRTIAGRFANAYWIKAEMNKLNHYSHSGHCYPELVQKQEGKVIAQAKCNLWKDDYQNINNNFLKILKEPLKDGIKILFLAKITFDPVHGLALRILEIDPAFTLGDLEKEKLETIDRLKAEGIFDSNKKRPISILPQRIAIISVETSKGYADFTKVIQANPWGYRFFQMLFPSILQGENAIPSMIGQLQRIKKVTGHFDAVAIIRGGGGDVGLSCYNNYRLAREIALFPIPVITGIGHATNETVVEMISFSNAITPTKIAEFLLQKFHNFSVPVQKAQEMITDKSKRLITEKRSGLQAEAKLFRSVSRNSLLQNHNQVKEQLTSLAQRSVFYFSREKRTVDIMQEKCKEKAVQYIQDRHTSLDAAIKDISYLDPKNVLKRGYSITYKNGKTIKQGEAVQEGDEIFTELFEGTITSVVIKKSGNE